MAVTSRKRPAQGLFIWGPLSLLAVGLGAWVCAQSGIPPSVWVRNPAAWLTGAAAAFALGRWAGPSLFAPVLLASAILLLASLLGAGQLGVHRWIDAGPVSMNIAMLALPAAIVALAGLAQRAHGPWRFAGWPLALGCLAILVAQPDASQTTAFALALIAIALGQRTHLPMRVGMGVRVALAGLAAVLAAAAWLRPDPLEPVPEVEGVLALAYTLSPVVALLALGSLLAASLAPALLARGASGEVRCAAVALSLYFLASALMPFIGAFPVPLTGVGISPVVGAWLGVGSLAALARMDAPARK